MHCYRQSASQTGKFIDSLQSLSIHCDGWLIVGLSRCRLVHYLSLFRADFEIIVVTGLWNSIHSLLHLPLLRHSLPCHRHRKSHLTRLSVPLIWLATFLWWIACHQSGSWLESHQASVSMAENTMLNRYSRTSENRTPLVPGISFGFLRRSVYWKFGNLKGRMMKTYVCTVFQCRHAHRMERNWKLSTAIHYFFFHIQIKYFILHLKYFMLKW